MLPAIYVFSAILVSPKRYQILLDIKNKVVLVAVVFNVISTFLDSNYIKLNSAL